MINDRMMTLSLYLFLFRNIILRYRYIYIDRKREKVIVSNSQITFMVEKAAILFLQLVFIYKLYKLKKNSSFSFTRINKKEYNIFMNLYFNRKNSLFD